MGRSPSASLGSPFPSTASDTTPTASSVATPACVATPAETEGPYFVDERLNRSDITTDSSTGSKRNGVPLDLTFQVARVSSSGCTSLGGAQVDVWHCDAAGVYSDVAAQSTVGQRFSARLSADRRRRRRQVRNHISRLVRRTNRAH